jgi:hypothetical protein
MRHFLGRALQHKRLPRSIRGLPGGVLAPAGPPGLVAPTRLPQRPPPRRLRTGRAAVYLTAVAPTADTRLPPAPTTYEHPRRLHREALPRRGTGAPVPTGEMLQALLQQRRLAGRGWAVGGCVRLPPSFSSRIRALFSSTCPRSGQTSEARANFAPRTHPDPPSGQVRIGFRRDSGIGHTHQPRGDRQPHRRDDDRFGPPRTQRDRLELLPRRHQGDRRRDGLPQSRQGRASRGMELHHPTASAPDVIDLLFDGP